MEALLEQLPNATTATLGCKARVIRHGRTKQLENCCPDPVEATALFLASNELHTYVGGYMKLCK